MYYKLTMSDIKKVTVFDERILQRQPVYVAHKGGLYIANQPFNAISQSSSTHTYQVDVPSQNVFVDRDLTWTSTFYLQLDVDVGTTEADAPVVVLGQDIALTAFPLNHMLSTLSATINDCNVTINSDDVLYEVLRLTDSAGNRMCRTCPNQLDVYGIYNSGVGSRNDVLLSYYDANYQGDERPNGGYHNIDFTDSTGAVLSGAGTYTNGYGVTAVTYTGGIPVQKVGNNGVYRVYLKVTSTEKLVLSPFMFANECRNDVGLYGINTMNFVMNLSSARVARTIRNAPLASSTSTASGCTFNATATASFTNSRIDCQFITPSLDIPLPAVSSVPFMEFPRYKSTGHSAVASGASSSISSQSITIPQIPDMLVIYAKPSSYSSIAVADWYFPITGISMNFDNNSGQLASHTKEQLYEICVENGLNMDYDKWSGKARVASDSAPVAHLVGGMLVLKPGKDWPLASGQAPGLAGRFTMQFSCTVNNRSAASATPELTIMTINSGFFESQQGSSRLVKRVLSEADIINAPMIEDPDDVPERMVGSGLFGKLGSLAKKALKNKAVQGLVKGELERRGHSKAAKAVDIASSVSGSGMHRRCV